MATTQVIGSDVCLFITTSGATKQVIAGATTCKLDISLGMIKTSNKDSGNFESSIGGRFSWTASSDQFYMLGTDASRITYDQLMTYFLGKTPITITIGATSGATMPQVIGTGKVLSGTVIISKVAQEFKDSEAVTYSIDMEGISALTYV